MSKCFPMIFQYSFLAFRSFFKAFPCCFNAFQSFSYISNAFRSVFNVLSMFHDVSMLFDALSIPSDSFTCSCSTLFNRFWNFVDAIRCSCFSILIDVFSTRFNRFSNLCYMLFDPSFFFMLFNTFPMLFRYFAIYLIPCGPVNLNLRTALPQI